MTIRYKIHRYHLKTKTWDDFYSEPVASLEQACVMVNRWNSHVSGDGNPTWLYHVDPNDVKAGD